MENSKFIQAKGTKKGREGHKSDKTTLVVVKNDMSIKEVTKSMTLDRKEYMWLTLTSLLRIHSQPPKLGQ